MMSKNVLTFHFSSFRSVSPTPREQPEIEEDLVKSPVLERKVNKVASQDSSESTDLEFAATPTSLMLMEDKPEMLVKRSSSSGKIEIPNTAPFYEGNFQKN